MTKNNKKTKKDREVDDYATEIMNASLKAVPDWLTASEVSDGAIFRFVRKGNRLGGALNDNSVYRFVQRRLKLANYNEKQSCAQ